jgi:undecaprenyl-diphosphatase
MDFVQALILGLLQGLTEWLPISSSGHLAIAQRLMNLTIPVGFYALLHLGTLIAVVIFFFDDLEKIFKSVIRRDEKDENFKFFIKVLIGLIPTAIIALLFLSFFNSLFSNMKAVGIGFLITGTLLLLSRFGKGNKKLNRLNCLLIGIVQGISIAPGISRSGSTISTGLLRSVKKEEVFKYSFLLSIPVVIGWVILDFNTLLICDFSVYSVIGMFVSAVSGFIAIKIVYRMLLSEKFYLFAAYCFILGIAVLITL